MRRGLLASLTLIFLASVTGNNNDDCDPKQTHLTYGDTTAEVVVMWVTKSECDTKVLYSTNMWKIDQSATGKSNLFKSPQNKDGAQVIHRVKLSNLSPSETYFYKPVSNKMEAGPFFFKTPSLNSTDELKLLVLGNLKTSSKAIPDLGKEAQSGKYAAILHTGNIAMNMSSDNGKNADKYFREMEPSIAKVPYLTAPGESEMEGGLYSHYRHRLSTPDTKWPIPLTKMWYSLDIGLVHLVSFSTDVFYTNEGKYAAVQHNWLIADLKAANLNREKVPWVIAFGHEPLYCSYEDPDLQCNKKTSEVKKALEDIFYHYGVDVVLQSYGKAYERSLPMYKGVPVNDNYTDPLGPVLVVSGGASSWREDFNFTQPAPEWVANRVTNHTSPSYGRLSVFNSSVIQYEQVAFSDGSVLDSFTISQDKHGQFSTENLSPNITAEINKEIVDSGGKPGHLNIHETGVNSIKDIKTTITELFEGENKNKTITVVASVLGSIVGLIVLIIVVRKVRRKRRVTRRWEQMDINYGKKFYSKAPDKEEENDFEIDMSDAGEPTRKLLNADD